MKEAVLALLFSTLLGSMQPCDYGGGGSVPGGGWGSSGSPIEPFDPPPFCVPDLVNGGEICF